jgi:hypothetical protein
MKRTFNLYQTSSENKSLFIILLFYFTFILNAVCYGQPAKKIEFVINGFTITLDNLGEGNKPKNANLENLITIIQTNPDHSINGLGFTKFRGTTLQVKFKNIKLKKEQNSNKIIAIAGQVVGSTRGNVSYNTNGYNVSFKWESVSIDPSVAYSYVTVLVPLHSCSSNPADVISFTSERCRISSDGSIYDNKFSGTGEFMLKESVYEMKIMNNSKCIVKLGNGIDVNDLHNGVYFNGNDQVGLFNIDCLINEIPTSSKIQFKLKLPLSRRLEGNATNYYFLKLKNGFIDFKYDSDTLTLCNGSFNARLKLPTRYNKIADINVNEAIDTFDLLLSTDKTNALFNYISLIQKSDRKPYKFKIGSVSFESATNGTWVYFPNWITDNSSSFMNIKENATCAEILSILKIANNNNEKKYDKNPGLTLLKGIIFLTSSQVDYSYIGNLKNNEANTIKTLFLGNLAFTPFGINGIASSEGNTFVPFPFSTDSCRNRRNYLPYTWEQIISKGDTKPNPVKELFRIQKVNILKMKLLQLRICNDTLDNNSTCFRYFVHFPYPTYMNLEFEDKSFDTSGKFSKALGPISLYSTENSQNAINSFSYGLKQLGPIAQAPKDLVQIPYAYIFWAWRLPVSFADKGIEIDYQMLLQHPEKGIAITMSDNKRNNLNEIYSNELWIPPLYSDSSAFKKGVRFKGYLTLTGMFYIDSWDKQPFFGKHYSKKFKCDLNNITLAPWESKPRSRIADFNWSGDLHFPFFSYENINTWNKVNFQVKDIIPSLSIPIDINKTEREKLICDIGILTTNNAGSKLALTVNKMKYDNNLGGFICDSVIKGDDILNGNLELYSYSHALLLEKNISGKDTILSSNLDASTGKWVIERMKGALPSTNITDLVCYDPLAKAERDMEINNSSCCSYFIYGTYQVISTFQNSTDSIITLSATNAKWFPDEVVNKLSLENSDLSLKSDDDPNAPTQIINIPGMQLTYLDGGYFGAFGSTYTPLAMNLPYEGEFRFYLDPQKGYFYLLGAGTFTIFGVPFMGQTFIFHIPRYILDAVPFPDNTTTPLLEDMEKRSLSSSGTFVTDTQLTNIGSTAIITGFLTSGGVTLDEISLPVIEVSLSAGFTNYVYYTKSTGTYYAGLFANGIAHGAIDIKLFSVDILGKLHVSLNGHSSPNFDGIINSFSSTHVTLDGDICLSGCLDTFLGSIGAHARTGARLSTDSGFDFDSFDFAFSCSNCE